RRISPDLKECALRLWELGWEPLEITQILCVSRSSLYRWQKIFDEFGTPTNPHARVGGRPSIITRAVLTAIHDVYKGAPDLYLQELQFWLAIHHNIAISISALQKTLEQAGLNRKLLQKIASERDLQKHTTGRAYGRAIVGERAVIESDFVRGPRYSVGAAMTTDGYIAVKVVEGSFDSLSFFDFTAESVIPQMNPYYPGSNHSVLILDNCRLHHNTMLQELVNGAGQSRS
ncbi:hypothetical protein C8R43DRAFT_826562, partial [Mycena crocata]